jgi:hypothetical protein
MLFNNCEFITQGLLRWPDIDRFVSFNLAHSSRQSILRKLFVRQTMHETFGVGLSRSWLIPLFQLILLIWLHLLHLLHLLLLCYVLWLAMLSLKRVKILTWEIATLILFNPIETGIMSTYFRTMAGDTCFNKLHSLFNYFPWHWQKESNLSVIPDEVPFHLEHTFPPDLCASKIL